MLKFLFFTFIFFFLVRFIGRRFLSGGQQKNGNFSFFYQTFKNVRKQQKQQKNHHQQQAEQDNVKNRLDDIEEAEYEDVTEEKSD